MRNSNRPPVSPMDMDKVRSTLKQFVRDWSKQGERERKLTYDPIIQELNTLYQHVPADKRGDIRVLVPGAGLGRLAFDIASQGIYYAHINASDRDLFTFFPNQQGLAAKVIERNTYYIFCIINACS